MPSPSVQHTTSAPELASIARATVGCFPEMDAASQRVSLSIYRILGRGRPASLEDIASDASVSRDEAEHLLEVWPGVYRDSEGSVIGYWGLTLQETSHRMTLDDGTRVYAWCAWDTLFLPPLLGQGARIESRDPISQEEVELTLNASGGLTHAVPTGLRMSYVMPKLEMMNTIISSFCHHILFLASERTAAHFVSERPDSIVLTLEQALELAQIKNRAQYPTLAEGGV